jgi:hypothetical protein
MGAHTGFVRPTKPEAEAQAREGDGVVKLAKRLAVALGSLLALAFAGGAHIRW